MKALDCIALNGVPRRSRVGSQAEYVSGAVYGQKHCARENIFFFLALSSVWLLDAPVFVSTRRSQREHLSGALARQVERIAPLLCNDIVLLKFMPP